MQKTYIKFRFTSNAGSTAGVVIDSKEFKGMSIPYLSRFFPVSESRFMRKIQVSPEFPTWDAAFNFSFPQK